MFTLPTLLRHHRRRLHLVSSMSGGTGPGPSSLQQQGPALFHGYAMPPADTSVSYNLYDVSGRKPLSVPRVVRQPAVQFQQQGCVGGTAVIS